MLLAVSNVLVQLGDLGFPCCSWIGETANGPGPLLVWDLGELVLSCVLSPVVLDAPEQNWNSNQIGIVLRYSSRHFTCVGMGRYAGFSRTEY